MSEVLCHAATVGICAFGYELSSCAILVYRMQDGKVGTDHTVWIDKQVHREVEIGEATLFVRAGLSSAAETSPR